MKVLFVYRGCESLAVETLSSSLKKSGYQTELVFDPALFDTYHIRSAPLAGIFNADDCCIDRILMADAGLVAFSLNTEDYLWACKIAGKVKACRDVPVIFGGVHPSAVPEAVIGHDFVDYVCVGEGEEALVELARAIAAGSGTDSILNIWSKKNGKIIRPPVRGLIPDLDLLPFPDKDLFYSVYEDFCRKPYMIQTGRGCLYQCAYCYGGYIREIYQGKGKFLRRRSVGNVIEELKTAKQKYAPQEVLFCDDIFVHDREWMFEFLPAYRREINIPFLCLGYPSIKEIDSKMVGELKKSGCKVVNIGVQSIDESHRKQILSRPGTTEEIGEIIKIFNEYNLYLCMDIIIGMPFQDAEHLVETIKFFNTHKPYAIAVSWLKYFPRTKICLTAKESGVISKAEFQEYQRGKAFSPKVYRRNSRNRQLARLGNLLLVAHVFPKRMVDFILRHKIYRIFPVDVPHFLMLWIRILYVKLVRRAPQVMFLCFKERMGYYGKFLVQFLKDRFLTL